MEKFHILFHCLFQSYIQRQPPNTFAFPVSGSPATPATGTISAAYSYVEEGQVRIGFTRDNDTSIIPSSTEVNTVKDKILEIKPAHMNDNLLIKDITYNLSKESGSFVRLSLVDKLSYTNSVFEPKIKKVKKGKSNGIAKQLKLEES